MKNILIAEFRLECNRSSSSPTDEAAFRDRRYLFGDEIPPMYRGVKDDMGGFYSVFGDLPDFTLVPVLALNACPGGPVTDDVFDMVRTKLLDAITPETDGILLALHGAMVTDTYEDGEGALLEALRQKVGPHMPIMASLDLHCNLTRQMLQNATALFPCDYYPHTDGFDAGVRAAECMRDTLLGKIKPVMAGKILDMLLPLMPTAEKCFAPFLQRAQALRRAPGMLNANIVHGFFHADIREMGLAVLTVTDGDPVRAQAEADALAQSLWEARHTLVRSFTPLDEAIDRAAQIPGTVTFADVSDNPGAGGTGDGTHMLRRLLERGVQDVVFSLICDPETVRQAQAAGVGATVDVVLGGKVTPELSGEPIREKAYVRALTDGRFVSRDYQPGTKMNLSACAVLEIRGIRVIVSASRAQPWDLNLARSCGLSPEDYKILAVKSSVHFYASHSKVSQETFYIELPALAPQTPGPFPFRHVRRPIYPLDG